MYDIDKSIETTINVPFAKHLSIERLLDIIISHKAGQYQNHIEYLFTEVPIEMIEEFVCQNNISFADMEALFSTLSPVYKTKKMELWLHEMASAV